MTDDPRPQPRHGDRTRGAFDVAERFEREETGDGRLIQRAFLIALVLHVGVLFARLPAWGPEPQRIEATQQQEMKVQFLKPPPPPPKVERKVVEPTKKKVPRPDPTPDEPEPEVVEPEPLPVESTAPPAPVTAPVAQGPVRVAPGQGPGLIKRVEPRYPPVAQSARLEGTVVLDAVINKNGEVVDIKVLREANPMFTQAAVDALKQWRYSPGPQDVILTVTVSFTMRR